MMKFMRIKMESSGVDTPKIREHAKSVYGFELGEITKNSGGR